MYQTNIEEKLSTISRQLRILENEKETYLSDHRRLNSVNQNLEAEKRDLLSLIEKKIKDNDRLNGTFPYLLLDNCLI